MSFINSLKHNPSKFLSRILSSLLVNHYSVCNSKEFVDYVQNFTIYENEILVSFDGVSLFTSVPVDKALGLVFDLLYSDESLASRTSLDIPDIVFLLQYFLTKTLFSNKYMALLWAFASLLSLLLFAWNTSSTQLSQHFTPSHHFG